MTKNIVVVCYYLFICFISVLCQLDEGSECIGENDGIKGKCVELHRCLSTVYDLKRKVHPQICSFKGRDPIICCTDCELVNDTRNVLVDKYGSHFFKSGQKATDKCLEYLASYDYPCPIINGIKRFLEKKRQCYAYIEYVVKAAIGGNDANRGEFAHMILCVRAREIEQARGLRMQCLEHLVTFDYPCSSVQGVKRELLPGADCYTYAKPFVAAAVGGHDAQQGEYPHMTLLGYGENLDNAQWLCGGSVISNRFILTAAHCISSSALGPVKFVALGILKRTDPSDQWQRYNVKRIIPHPQYKAPNKYHDIALLELDTKISFSRLVLPACLNTGDDYETWAKATGWGALGPRKALADTLQVVILQQFSATECSAAYPPHRHLPNGYDNNTQSCYGDKHKVIDTCEGDSGGPLQISSIHGTCVHRIIGVTSYGRQCGILGGTGMYTRVAYYVPWIESVVWP